MLTAFVICEWGMKDAKYAKTALVIAFGSWTIHMITRSSYRLCSSLLNLSSLM